MVNPAQCCGLASVTFPPLILSASVDTDGDPASVWNAAAPEVLKNVAPWAQFCAPPRIAVPELVKDPATANVASEVNVPTFTTFPAETWDVLLNETLFKSVALTPRIFPGVIDA